MARVLRSVWGFIKERYIWLLVAVWITVFIEYGSRGNWSDALLWSVGHFRLLLINVALVGCLLALAALPTGHTRVAFWLVGLPALLLGTASGIKLKMMGRPLLPWDFAVAGEAADVINWSDILNFSLIAGLAAFVGIGALLLHKLGVVPEKVEWKKRATVAAVAATMLAVFLVTPPGSAARAMNGEGSPWDQAHHVKTDGFLLSWTDNLRFMLGGRMNIRTAPGDVTAFLHTDVKPGTPADPASEKRQPNVILVLSESLFDPTVLSRATFSADPLPSFHSLQNKYPSGRMLSPEFAGSTANVELEVLTGLSMKLLPDGVLAYETHINRPVDSLASIFTRNGYRTTAISPWASWFFNSRKVYQNFGFGKFISVDFMKQEKNTYYYLADAEIARNIIAESRKTPGPDFIFANTAENHYDYNPGKFKQTEIKVTGLSADSNGILQEYAQGCLYADRMLKTLVDHYSQSGEPTLIVFFGDHLPLLGKNYGIYKEAGYLSENDPEFLNKIYRVPVVTWNNYLPDSLDRLDFGTNFLGPYIVNQAGVTGTPVTEYLRALSAKVPAVPPRRYWDAWKIPAADMEQYAALQDDILAGEQKAFEGFRDKIVNPDYVLGYGPIQVDRLLVDQLPAGGYVQGQVLGQNLPPGGTVVVNGRKVTTVWESYERYAIKVPLDVAGAADWVVQVKVFDLQHPEQVLAESGTLTAPMK